MPTRRLSPVCAARHPSSLEKNPKLRNLAEKLRQRFKIRYVESEKPGWGAVFKGDRLEITYSQSKYPAACLAHELLHADLQLQGYRRLRVSFTGHGEHALFNRLTTALDNELQHHRMFPEFVRTGFPPEQFYDDAETGTRTFVRERLADQSASLLALVPDYLTLLAPGGDLTLADRNQLEVEFMAFGGGRYRVAFEKIRLAFAEWTSAPNLDACPTVRAICQAIYPGPHYIWFGHSPTERPPAGFFVGEPFVATELHASTKE
jgi:hypothetical protein